MVMRQSLAADDCDNVVKNQTFEMHLKPKCTAADSSCNCPTSKTKNALLLIAITSSDLTFPKFPEPSAAQHFAFLILSWSLNLDSRLLTTAHEAFTERVFGWTNALASLLEYFEFQATAASS
jgi:hypothetical protein